MPPYACLMDRILVVDDNQLNAHIYLRVLSCIDDAEVVCFSDPFKALKSCHHKIPAVVVVDYRMPGLDGIQFIHHFREIHGAADIPIVMLTAVASPVLWQMAIDAGAAAFFLKPIDKHRFLESLERLIHPAPIALVERMS